MNNQANKEAQKENEKSSGNKLKDTEMLLNDIEFKITVLKKLSEMQRHVYEIN